MVYEMPLIHDCAATNNGNAKKLLVEFRLFNEQLLPSTLKM
jgi:hypothetical protein